MAAFLLTFDFVRGKMIIYMAPIEKSENVKQEYQRTLSC